MQAADTAVCVVPPCFLSSARTDLINVFEVFLPQLLTYPNPTDPLNGEAAGLMIRDPEKYSSKIKEYVEKFATDVKFDDEDEDDEAEGEESGNDSEMDSDSEDEQAAGKMDQD